MGSVRPRKARLAGQAGPDPETPLCWRARGCSSVVERQLPKLRTGFRLPSPALLKTGRNGRFFAAIMRILRCGQPCRWLRTFVRATSGHGSHAVVEDAVSAQFGDELTGFAKPTFERFRRTRNAAQYFDPDAPEISVEDAQWAIDLAAEVVEGVRRLLVSGAVSPYLPD